jgi:peptide/nickel transport system substrate-binding protein
MGLMRLPPIATFAATAALALAACGDEEKGPVRVSAIGGEPRLANPNREPLDAASSFLVEATAQGLVRFNAAGEIEPALAQRWIVSDDGLSYIFRITRTAPPGGERITAEQVAARLRAAMSPASRNPLKPLLGAVAEIVAMTDEVIEISLKSPRPTFLQLLAQPEMAVIRGGAGLGPYRAERGAGGAMLLTLPRPPEEAQEDGPAEPAQAPPVLLRGEAAALSVARFVSGEADLVVGGRAGDLPIAAAARPAGTALVFDPVNGLFGLVFAAREGPLATPEVRHALSMAIDRAALVAALRVPGLQARETILPPGLEGVVQPAAAPWSAIPLAERRSAAREVLGRAVPERLTVKIELPEGPGYRLLFAHLRRDLATVGVAAVRASAAEAADLRFVDSVAPAAMATWYLRHFSCGGSSVCDPAADEMLAAARIAPNLAGRRALLANADRIMTDAAPFIPLTAPVRWSLVSPRLTGFRPNPFARHPAAELIRPQT